MKPKCPKCEKTVEELKSVPRNVLNVDGRTFNGIVLCCDKCNTVLGSQIDPVNLADNLFKQIRKLHQK